MLASRAAQARRSARSISGRPPSATAASRPSRPAIRPAATISDATRRRPVEVTCSPAGTGRADLTSYGIEADLVGANLNVRSARTRGLEDEGTDPAFPWIRAKTDWFCTAHVKLGYAFDRNLVYASAGLAGANARVFADYPAPTGGLAASARRDLSFLGFALGAGFEHAITPHLSLGLDFRYLDLGESDRYLLGTVPVPGGGRVSTRSDFVANEMMARLAWHPEGLALPGGEAPAELDPRRYSLHGQATFVNQGVTGFHAPYSGEQSLVPHQAQATTTATAYLGFKLLEGTELYYNPEFSQGFGLSRTLGVAGFVNGEAQRPVPPSPNCAPGGISCVRPSASAVAPKRWSTPRIPSRGSATSSGSRSSPAKFAMSDYFDNNAYARDPASISWIGDSGPPAATISRPTCRATPKA